MRTSVTTIAARTKEGGSRAEIVTPDRVLTARGLITQQRANRGERVRGPLSLADARQTVRDRAATGVQSAEVAVTKAQGAFDNAQEATEEQVGWYRRGRKIAQREKKLSEQTKELERARSEAEGAQASLALVDEIIAGDITLGIDTSGTTSGAMGSSGTFSDHATITAGVREEPGQRYNRYVYFRDRYQGTGYYGETVEIQQQTHSNIITEAGTPLVSTYHVPVGDLDATFAEQEFKRLEGPLVEIYTLTDK